MRNGVFYYMVELPRQDGKRRYFIKSLHTKNYYEALEKAKNMKKAVELHTMDTMQIIFLCDQGHQSRQKRTF